MTRTLIPLTILTAAFLNPLNAAPPVIPAVGERMDAFVKSKEIAGAVTLVADADKILHLSATGMADIAAKKPMTTDAVFWIASMTKPITATAVMMMQEEGKLSVDDPVSKYLPEFTGDKSAITLKQCLTHSSGFADVHGDGIKTLEELMPRVVEAPLQFPPGSKWQYCQSGINTVARVVEVVSGKSFPEFLQERLFDPLDMKVTSFYPDDKIASRLAKGYSRTDSGDLKELPLPFLQGQAPSVRNRYPMANGGLFSTAEDYAKFCQMILHNGEIGGKRYLKPESVRQMTTVQSGDLVTGFTPGNGWGLGWCVVREPQGITAALSPGSFGHGGAFGTQAWIDPVKNRIEILMIQRADFRNQGGSDGSPVRQALHDSAK